MDGGSDGSRKNKPIRLCSTPECARKHYGNGFCRLHYKRAIAGIDQTPCIVCGADTAAAGKRFCGVSCRMKWHRQHGCYTKERMLKAYGACSINGCGKPVHAHGYCQVHKNNFLRNGDALVVRRRPQADKCVKCGADSQGGAADLCQRCYDNAYYYKNHPKEKARRSARRSYFKTCTPRWADLKAIARFYEACPVGSEVDHVVPVRGRKVCGLHVIDNLQYLSMPENRRKLNRFEIA